MIPRLLIGGDFDIIRSAAVPIAAVIFEKTWRSFDAQDNWQPGADDFADLGEKFEFMMDSNGKGD